MQLGDRDRALKCYRSIPDFEAALKLVRQIENHPAGPSLEWLAEVDALFVRRPDNFNLLWGLRAVNRHRLPGH